jgi:uncharacterized protein YkwD
MLLSTMLTPRFTTFLPSIHHVLYTVFSKTPLKNASKSRIFAPNQPPKKTHCTKTFFLLPPQPIKQAGEPRVPPRKLYYLTRHLKPRITFMQPSPKCRPNFLILPNLLILLPKSFAISALLLLFAAPHLHAQTAFEPENNLTVAGQYLLAAANEARANQGLSPLRLDPVLSEASAVHAREMASHDAISHQFDGEPELATRGANAGAHFSLIAENVGEAPTSVIIHDLWMHSPGHRANLLDPDVDTIGIAIVTRNHQLYAVEDFARTVQVLTLNQQERTVAGVLAQSGMRVAETTEDARQTCTMSTGYAGSRQPWFIMRYTAASLSAIPSQLKSRLSSGKYHQAVVGACPLTRKSSFTAYNIAVLLYP